MMGKIFPGERKSIMRAAAAITAAILLTVLPSEPSQGAQERQIVGKWEIDIDKDRFDDSARVFAALRVPDGFFAVRCLRGEISFVFASPGRLRVIDGESIAIIGRVNRLPTRTADGIAPDSRAILGELPRVFFDDLRVGGELALRFVTRAGSLQQDFVVPLDRAKEALAPVAEACGLQ